MKLNCIQLESNENEINTIFYDPIKSILKDFNFNWFTANKIVESSMFDSKMYLKSREKKGVETYYDSETLYKNWLATLT